MSDEPMHPGEWKSVYDRYVVAQHQALVARAEAAESRIATTREVLVEVRNYIETSPEHWQSLTTKEKKLLAAIDRALAKDGEG